MGNVAKQLAMNTSQSQISNFYTDKVGIISVKSFGAKGDNTADDSGKFQNAIDYLNSIGGGTLFIPKPTSKYYFKYPVFVSSNIKIVGAGGAWIRTDLIGTTGRCAFVVGNSREWNKEKTQENRTAGTVGSIVNTAYTDITLGTYLEPDNEKVEAKYSSIENLIIEFDHSAQIAPYNYGGYGIQFAHAANCYARNIITINANQAVGIGSDVTPNTPGCVDCHCYKIYVVQPDLVHTYYAVGFIANSQRCSIQGAYSPVAMTTDSSDGSLIGMNVTKDCEVINVKGKVGATATSEGFFVQNSQGARIKDCEAMDATKGFACAYTNATYLDANNPNLFINCTSKACTYGIQTNSKYNWFIGHKNINCTNDIYFTNTNATDNKFFESSNKVIVPPSGQTVDWAYKNNRIGEIIETSNLKDTYFEFSRFINPLDIANISGINNNKVVLKTYTGTVTFRVPLRMLGIKSVDNIKFYMTFNAGSQTASSSVAVTLYRRADFTGNSSAALTSEYTTTITPTADTTQDRTVSLTSIGAEEVSGIGSELILEIVWTNPVLNSCIKNAKIGSFA